MLCSYSVHKTAVYILEKVFCYFSVLGYLTSWLPAAVLTTQLNLRIHFFFSFNFLIHIKIPRTTFLPCWVGRGNCLHVALSISWDPGDQESIGKQMILLTFLKNLSTPCYKPRDADTINSLSISFSNHAQDTFCFTETILFHFLF